MPGVIPYVLRLSSNLRAIRAGIPIPAMHDTSVLMIDSTVPGGSLKAATMSQRK